MKSQVHTPGLEPGAPDHLSLSRQGRRVWLCSQRGGSQPASCLQSPTPTQRPAPPKSSCNRPTAIQGTPTSSRRTSWSPISSKPTPWPSSPPPSLPNASPYVGPPRSPPDSPLFSAPPPPRSKGGPNKSDKLAGTLRSCCSVSISRSGLTNTNMGPILCWRNNPPVVELPRRRRCSQPDLTRTKVGQLFRSAQSSLCPTKPATESTCRNQTCEI